MAKYSNTKAKINEKITTNSAQAITGNILNDVLQAMVDSLGADYQFGGLVQPGSTFTAGEQPVVFLATTPGTYTNFGGLVVADGDVALLVWSGTAWSKQTPDIATRTEVSQLGQKVTDIDCGLVLLNESASPSGTIPIPTLSLGKKYYVKFTLSVSKTLAVTLRAAEGSAGAITQTIASSTTYDAGDHILPFVFSDASGIYLRIGESSVWSSVTNVYLYESTTDSVREIGSKVDTIAEDVYALDTTKVIAKNTIVSTNQQIYLHVGEYGKAVALRVLSNTSGGTLMCGIRANGSSTYHSLSSSYYIHTSSYDIDRVYIYLENATSAGSVEVELLYGDSVKILQEADDISVLQTRDAELENKIGQNSLLLGKSDSITKTYAAGETTALSMASRIPVFIPKDSKFTIDYSISSGLFSSTIDNLALYIIYSKDDNDNRSSINFLNNKRGIEVTASADIYAFALAAYDSSSNILSTAIEGSIGLIIDYFYTPVNNRKSIDLMNGGFTTEKRYISGTTASLSIANATNLFIPKGSRITLDYDYTAGLFGSATIDNISLYLLHSKNSFSDRTSISFWNNKRGIEITLSKDVYGLCVAVYSGSTPLHAATSGTFSFIVGYIYSNVYAGKGVDALGYDSRLDVPSYYHNNNYIESKVARIKQVSANNDGDNFIFITDTHWDRNAQKSVALLKYLYDNGAYYKRIIHGGDISQLIAGANASGKAINEIDPSRIDYLRLLGVLKNKVYYTIGNHEYLTLKYPTQGLFNGVDFNNWHNYLYYPDETDFEVTFGDEDNHYYYLDNKKKKIRYIFLSSFSQSAESASGSEYIITANENYDATQLAWLTNTALNVESGWDIIVFTHRLVTVNFSNQHTNDQTFSVTTKQKEYCKALLQYNGNGNILAVIAGHTHRDGMIVINDALLGLGGSDATGKQLFEIITTCDANNFEGLPDEVLEDRDSNTINEQAFDYVSIDQTAKRISLIRIGAPANNVVDYSGTLEERNYVCEQVVLQVGGSITLDSKLGGTITWSSSNTSVVSINGSTISGVSAGVATITATNDSNYSVMYMVKVVS